MCEKNKQPHEIGELTDEELGQAGGGADTAEGKYLLCDKCGMVLHEFRGDAWYCTACGNKNILLICQDYLFKA